MFNPMQWEIRMLKRACAFAAALACVVAPASAQTIYPLDRAEILAGARFDLKVEFPGAPAQGAVDVLIDGRPAAEVLGKAVTFVEKEDGGSLSAYWMRDVDLKAPGNYTVVAKNGDKSASVSWQVYDTPPQRAKNVILFIGDGLSVAHRTAA